MATTYDPTLIATSQLYQARDLIGDTGSLVDAAGNKVWLKTDEEINGWITAFGWAEGLAKVCDSLVSKVSQQPTEYKDEAGMDVKFTDRIAAWRGLAASLRSGINQSSKVVLTNATGDGMTGPDMTGLISKVFTSGL